MSTWNDNDARNARFQEHLDQMARGEHSGKRPSPDRCLRPSDLAVALHPDNPDRIAIEVKIMTTVAADPVTRYDLYRLVDPLPWPWFTCDVLDPIVDDLVKTGQLIASETDVRLGRCLFSIPQLPPETHS